MENITIGQIAGAIGIISIIGGFVATIVKSVMNWYKKKITNKFDETNKEFEEINKKFKEVDKKIVEIESRLEYIERKREEYEREIGNSKEERSILMEGELSALKALRALLEENKSKHEEVGKSIKRIEEYILEKSHD